jgi:hypothetical protein
MTELRYRSAPDAPLERARLKGDPFEICNAVARKLGLEIQLIDVKFDALMRRRAAEAREGYERERRT